MLLVRIRFLKTSKNTLLKKINTFGAFLAIGTVNRGFPYWSNTKSAFNFYQTED
ncbi:hypothetical protein [Microcystis aeruginosa]|uniref:hypothetical protein n=1 Tax=Microcystis aeruginosa TaxID=1126 RepID=UPI001C85AECD|nr:hypothetical protein [Microcystis aeruginosa]